ncbi:MAG TPA: hypothetical protein VEX38_08805, partial [Fimbriimonadaceae bacterium]|nr:hypothetical protein [Fimbriimonadaceae bacterium]
MRARIAARLAAATLFASVVASSFAAITVYKGTEIPLRFEQSLSSMKAKAGDRVRFTVDEDIVIEGKTVVRKGTPVSGRATKVKGHGKYGVNAQIRIQVNPVRTVAGRKLSLEPKYHGKQ